MTMKARVERDVFAKALKIVSPHTPKMTAKAVLNGVRMDGDGKHLTLTCTDLDVTVQVTIDAKAEGSAIAPAGLLTRLVGAMGAGTVLVKADEMVQVECGDTLAELHPYQLDDWPKLEQAEGDTFTFDADVWARIGRVVGFASPDHQRSPLDCVHFAGDMVNVTDSHRAARLDLDGKVPECLVSAQTVQAVLRVADAPVEFTVGQRIASFTSGGVTWTTRLVEYERGYPKLSQFFDAKGSLTLTFPSDPLLAALTRLTLVDGSDGSAVKITRDGDKAILTTTQTDVGSLTEVVSCSGDFVDRVAFHGPYLKQLVEAIAADEVTFQLTDSLKHATIEGDGIAQILMPVRVQG
jgi:DNA polymerase III sliding clamp (beta) subunit (PCNA family)